VTENTFFLALIQGITEFLPISSSMHVDLYNQLTRAQALPREMDVVLHGGTLLAVLVYFWRDIFQMAWGLITWLGGQRRGNPYATLAWALIVATVPCVLVGFALKRLGFELHGLKIMAMNSLIFGALLGLCDRYGSQTQKHVSVPQGLAIGFAQVLAFLPGVSRSGACLTMARFLGMERVMATRFIFLLSIPTVLGAVILTVYDMLKEGAVIDAALCGQATALTACVGLLTIHGLLHLLTRYSFAGFAFYRMLLGAFILLCF
jgi:undecaprenyl-diphosphatase